MQYRPPDPREILRRAGLSAKKSWGQNFLLDQTVLASIAEATGAGPDCPVVELGAGLGALTYYLVRRGGRVIAVERDRELAPLLRAELAWAEELVVEEADAATLDYAEMSRRLGGNVMVAGNLPYQISSRILVDLAGAASDISGAVLLVQREVAHRLAAGPGSKTYGLLSVLVQRAHDVDILRTVRPGSFHPPPKVTSAVVRLRPCGANRSAQADKHLVASARAAFSSRRKTLRNAVVGALNAERPVVEAALEEARLEPSVRAETLSIDDFARLGAALAAAGLLDD